MSAETLTTLTYNVRRGFDDEQSTDALLRLVDEKQPNIVGFLEASSAREGHDLANIENASGNLRDLGYNRVTSAPYRTADGREDEDYLLIASNIDDADHREGHDGVRSTLDVVIPDISTIFKLRHFVDREAGMKPQRGSHLRLVQALKLPEGNPETGEIWGGDFNAADPSVFPANLYRMLRGPSALLPSIEPGTPLESLMDKFRRMGSIIQRATDMPNQTVYDALTMGAGMTDANTTKIATHKIGMAIDGNYYNKDNLVSRNFSVLKGPETEYEDVNGEVEPISDHWPLLGEWAVKN